MTADMGQPGQIIDGKYRITRLLGTGGMGAVYEGENVRIRRKVAIKMLHASVGSQPEVVARFEREAQAAALVGSEHICEVLDLGERPDHTRYMVMEYLEGETLSSLIKRSGRLLPQQTIPLLAQILDALGAAHAAGIIHRDLKPDNVFILPQRGGIQSFIKILDFGVSKFSQLGGEAMNVTRAGAVVGTPYYMSPEQARGSSAIDARTDIYAIGVLLYQASTGQVPYQAETFNELLFKIVLEVAPPPQTYAPDIDPAFAAIIQRAMAREPDQRFQNCAQFKEALLQFQAARQNPLPQYAMPRPHEPMGARTQALDTSQLPQYPSGASWPGAVPATEGTMPLQPGLPMAAITGSGVVQAPVVTQSGASWAAASNPGAAAPTATANSWGNASSPSATNIARPKSKAPLVLGVIGLAALLGVGAAVAAVTMMGKSGGKGTAATSAPVETAAPTVPSAIPSVASAAPSAEPSAAPSVEVTPPPTASATVAVTAAPAPVKPTVGGKLPPTKPPPAKPPTKPAKPGKTPGNDLGY